MKRMVWGALVALSLNVSGAAHAELKPYWTDGEWSVHRNISSCMLSAEYKNNTMLMIIFDYRLKKATVSFTDPSIKSLKDGDARKIEMVLANKKRKSTDGGWGENDFQVSIVDGETQFSKSFVEEILTDVAQNDFLGFFYKDVLLQSFELSESSVAIQSLRDCAHQASRDNPSDPFANEK